eukprot:TRINITY_DN30381_c0_g1_i1.p1 TRINITY_DN30381_c0_g1~~TRINITY_DN30381_c0_g1_i1.p1  ORF type:complete len:420 (+),score=95.42 TRINITY_DN30381_c0_g1_i1:49-1308(+)
MSELGCDYAGTKYELKLDDEGKELLQRAMEGEACGEEISVIYVDDDIEDEVDACWLAGVMKDFDACRRILAHDRTTSKEMMHDLVVKAFEANDTELMSRILSSLPTKHAVYKIDPEILFEDRFSEDLIEFCIESGFRCDSLQGVAPCASRKCLLYCKATMHIPVSPYSTEPISEGTTLCEADLFLMRMLINGAVSVPIYQAALAVRSNLKPATSLTWVGHFIYAASLNKNDDFWRATVRTTAFWDYASERGVSKNELLTVKSGKPITYPSRLRWIMVEIFPTVSELRKARVIEFVTEEQAKVTTTVAASVLIDPVAQGIDMILGTPTANSTPSAAQKALDLDPFAAAVEKSSSLISVSTSSKLQLYSYYKQATEGDCTIPKPGMFEMEKKAKWDAWTGVTGLSKEDAKTKYINLVNSMV